MDPVHAEQQTTSDSLKKLKFTPMHRVSQRCLRAAPTAEYACDTNCKPIATNTDEPKNVPKLFEVVKEALHVEQKTTYEPLNELPTYDEQQHKWEHLVESEGDFDYLDELDDDLHFPALGGGPDNLSPVRPEGGFLARLQHLPHGGNY